ncbi:MAG: HEAT repeat domain-containing protein [Planctomycetes bacterium]|nr:HEAT repeat domain-containing protein [Planctomycetota bacterium]
MSPSTSAPGSPRLVVIVAFLIGGTLGAVVGRWSAALQEPGAAAGDPASRRSMTVSQPPVETGPDGRVRPRGAAVSTGRDPGTPVAEADLDAPESGVVDAGSSDPVRSPERDPVDLARDGSLAALPPEALKHLPTLLAELEKASAEGSERKAEYLGGLLYDLLVQEPTLAPEYVAAFRRVSDPAVLEWLGDALGDALDEASNDWNDDDPRLATLTAMRKLVTDAMLDVVARDPSEDRRVAAMEPLRQAEWSEIGPTLRSVARGAQSGEVRAEAVRMLGRGPGQPENVGVVMDLLRSDADPEVRREAARALRDTGGSGMSTQALLDAFRQDPDGDVRLEAVEALARQGAGPRAMALPAIGQGLAVAGDVEYRRRLLSTFVRMGGRDASPHLGGLVEDPQIGVDAADYLAIMAEGVTDWRQIMNAKRNRDRARDRQREQAPK